MLSIIQISKEISKKNKLSQEEVKKILTDYLEIVKQNLRAGEAIAFKGYFTVKRLTTKAKGNKNCDEHHRELEKYKLANKGKGIAAYAKSPVFRNLAKKTKECNKCKAKKQSLVKLAKPTNRVSFKVSKDF